MTAELEKIARQSGGYKAKLNKVNQKYGLRYRVEELTLKAYNEFENKWRNS